MPKTKERKPSSALIRDRRTLTTRRIVFLVIAAAAPLAAMIGNVPLAIVYGNGAGLPVAYLLAAVVLLCFSVGYAAMSRRVINTGAFYTYISRALGKEVGVGAAYLALASYTAMACGLAGGFGYFVHELIKSAAAIDIPWYFLSALGVAIVGFMGYRSVDLSAKVLGFLMVAEFLVLIVFEILVVAKQGTASFPSQSFTYNAATSGPFGIAALIAFTSFIGFESAALYGEETKDPERSIPRATYIAVISVGVFYVITAWMIIGATGISKLSSQANRDGGVFVLNLLNQYGGEVLFDIGAVLLCTSVLAGYSALHNAASRYLFALGRENIAPSTFGEYHKDFFSPHIASIAITAMSSIAVIAFAAGGADPYKVFAASLIAVGTLGIVALQAFASLSVVVFFWKRRDRKIWQGTIAPLIGFVGLTAAFILATTHYNTLTGSDSPIINLVPYLLLFVAVGGVINGIRIRRHKPVVYAKLAATRLRSRVHADTQQLISYDKKYCLVGAGPAGLVMARSLIKEGVPFDWFEKHSDVGGIWDLNNPGTPMYESCHFISSKYTSGFYGFPMPAHYPDYPSGEQILQYIRDFADAYDLKRQVTFNTSVVKAEPLPGEKWQITFSNGKTEIYDGLINATGVTWHANRPSIKGEEKFKGEIIHSVKYRSPQEFQGKRVLIVGAGNSGVDIASDAAVYAEQAYLSVRRGYRFIPKYLFGVPTDALISGKIAPPRGVSVTGDASKLIDTVVGDLTRYGLPKPDHDLLASHPIMNTQVLHHLGHGDLIAKPDVQEIDETGVTFADGTHVDLDLIVLATGYNYSVPYLDKVNDEWKDGRPQLYLRVFSRNFDNLYYIGYAEFADAAYRRFDEMAQMVIIDIRARATGIYRDELQRLKKSDNPDLAGGHKYIDSPRHTNYIEVDTYLSYLANLRDRFDWPDVDEETYQSLTR